MAPVSTDPIDDSLRAKKSGDKKRKFRDDPPGNGPDNTSSSANVVDLSFGLSFRTDDMANDVVNWSLPTANEVHKLATSIFETMLRGAIKKIVASSGYSEKLVNKAMLKKCSHYGLKDVISAVIDNTLLFLKDVSLFDLSRAHYFDDLEKMAEHIVWELACNLRRFRPFLSIGDAFWLLILGDMSISGACSLIDNSSGETSSSEFHIYDSPTCELAKPEESTVGQNSSTDEIKSEKPKGSDKREQEPKITETPLADVETATAKITKTPLVDKTETKPDLPETASQEKAETKLFDEITKMPLADVETASAKTTKTPLVDGTETASQEKEETELFSEITEMPPKPDREKDAILTMLTWREGALREKVRAWDEWAREKVMQATKRLVQDKAELRALREERESSEQTRREREEIRDAMEKKILEAESYLRKSVAQLERVTVEARNLEGENGRMRIERGREMLRAEEAAERMREGVRREKEREARARAWEREKEVAREEVEKEKRRGERLDKEVESAQVRRNRIEVRLKQEQNAKDKLLKEANLVRNERKEIKASAKKEMQEIYANAEASLKKHNDDVQKLEKEISELRLKNDASIIAALRQGVKKLSPEEAHICDLSRREISALDDVAKKKRERECVMCLSEDRKVIFLPCAHQVLCKDCNEIHEKHGKKDCPSCRTVIQERICVRYASERG